MKRIVVALTIAIAVPAGARTHAVSHPVTYNAEIVRLLQDNCQGCHRPGGIGPFSLMTYDDAKTWAIQMWVMTSTHQMPPWKPADGCMQFIGRRRLDESQIATIRQWIAQGEPEGSPADLPPARSFESRWTLGPPDLVLSPEAPYTPASTGDTFRCFVLPAVFPEDRYVRAIDVQPEAKEFVHHVSITIDLNGDAARLDAADPAPGFDLFDGGLSLPTQFLGTWVPNSDPFQLPSGTAMKLPAGSRLMIQVHYHPHEGEIHADQTQVAVYFEHGRVEKLARSAQFYVNTIDLPAGAKNVAVSTEKFVPEAMEVFAILPHMHYLGRTIEATAVLPSGERQCLVEIDDWSIRWQSSYRYATPITLPAGTKIEVHATYDNSAGNPDNPSNPPRDVHQGYLATDEMCGVELTWAPPAESLSIYPP